MAVSVHFLDFYHALFERSCDAVNAMASALNTFYVRRGFILLNKKVCNSIKSWVTSTRLISNNRDNRFRMHFAGAWVTRSSGMIFFKSTLSDRWSQHYNYRIQEFTNIRRVNLRTRHLLNLPCEQPWVTSHEESVQDCSNKDVLLALQGLCMGDHLYSKAIPQMSSMLHTYLFL